MNSKSPTGGRVSSGRASEYCAYRLNNVTGDEDEVHAIAAPAPIDRVAMSHMPTELTLPL